MDNKECLACRLCGVGNLEPLFNLGNHLVNDFPLPADVGKGPRCPIEIVMCGKCGLVQQRWSAPQELLYRRHYHYRSGTTATMRAALQEVADKSATLADLQPGDVVLDIGSNDGTGLRCYPDGVKRVGFEPADNLLNAGAVGVDLLFGDFWRAERYLTPDPESGWDGKQAKVVSAIGMFYDLEDPGAFVRDVAEVLAPDGVFVAQLMCLRQMVDTNDVGNLCHEHLEFYSLHCLLEHLLAPAGLRCFDIEENAVNGGSYRLWCCHAGEKRPPGQDHRNRVARCLGRESDAGLTTAKRIKEWWAGLEENRRKVRLFLKGQAELGKRVWVLGASTKGNTILQWLDLPLPYLDLHDGVIQAAVDRDPEKVGRCTVNGLEIFSEEAFRAAKPDFALVLPHAFRKEIEARDAAWRAGGGQFVYILPSFEVV